MADQRNFRSAYLEKVGIKGVEEVKAIEILLREQPLDKSKLLQFCQRFPVPAVYRCYLWKVLLGVLPSHQQCHEYVSMQRTQQYNDIHQALTSMRRIDGVTPLAEVHLRMHLIENTILPFDEQQMFQDPLNQVYLHLSTAMSEVTDDQVDLFWMTTKLHLLLCNNHAQLPHMVERVEHYLGREDADGKLVSHLQSLGGMSCINMLGWFHTAFAGVLPGSTFERIWDKVIGGCLKILTYTAVAILLTFKRPLLSMNNINSINLYLARIPDDSGDIIVNKALEICSKYGHVIGASKGESPNFTDRTSSFSQTISDRSSS